MLTVSIHFQCFPSKPCRRTVLHIHRYTDCYIPVCLSIFTFGYSCTIHNTAYKENAEMGSEKKKLKPLTSSSSLKPISDSILPSRLASVSTVLAQTRGTQNLLYLHWTFSYIFTSSVVMYPVKVMTYCLRIFRHKYYQLF